MNKISFFTFCIILFNGCDGENKKNIYMDQRMKNNSAKTFDIGYSVYMNSCASCHSYGISGAPNLSDFDYWNLSADKGMDTILTSLEKGYIGDRGVMPPKGNCFSCSEEELKASMIYIFQKVKSNKINKENL